MKGGRNLIAKDPLAAGTSGHKRLRDFVNAEDRDRWRSLWARFPRLSALVMSAYDPKAAPAGGLDYRVEIEKFACSWYDAGFPLPADYAAPDAQPIDDADRAYQTRRGRGDGRRVAGVMPTSRRLVAQSIPLIDLGSPRFIMPIILINF